MPASSCAGCVFGDKNLMKIAGRDTGEDLRATADYRQEVRHVPRFGQAAIKVVAPAE